jgi:hypothetical protein
VLEAQIGGLTLKKVFMDGDSCINLIYIDTLQKINIQLSDLLPSETSFHDIVPRKQTYSLGMTNLDVIFGTPANFGKEIIKFQVVDWRHSTMPLGMPT